MVTVNTSNITTTWYYPVSSTIYLSKEPSYVARTSSSKVIAVLVFIMVLLIIFTCVYWLILLWKKHMTITQIQAPLVLSYAIILPWIFERNIAMIYYYYNDEHSQNAFQTASIIYSPQTDLTLHFSFWFSFWIFIHLNIYRAVLIRTHQQYKEINEYWKSLVLQIVISMTIFLVQLIIRLSSKSVIAEQSIILFFVLLEIFACCKIMYGVFNGKDITQKERNQMKYILYLCIVGWIYWFICFLIWLATNADFYWTFSGGFYAIWLLLYCYLETVCMIEPDDSDEIEVYDGLADFLSMQQGFDALMMFLDTDSQTDDDMSCVRENILCYIELSQFIMRCYTKYTPENIGQMRYDRSRDRCDCLIIGFLRCQEKIYAFYLPHDVISMVVAYYMRLYFLDNDDIKKKMINKNLYEILDHDLEENVYDKKYDKPKIEKRKKRIRLDNQYEFNQFNYFDVGVEWKDDIDHIDYLKQKYLGIDPLLKINISILLNEQIKSFLYPPGIGSDNESFLELINTLKRELWYTLIKGAREWTYRFKASDEYQKYIVIRDQIIHST